ncbi:hypothetical protein HII36_05465 [Nonomuraea sp. NN258]|uniref:hypothetical protein n=1 Tax=Nonomuraea antri TaxID=2730852 RepID=UPI001568872F|nr:hypothetical protein [Nonomuraea antri]NRQ31286.1 hypothetical protein [Nonomuraea antri]
MSDDTLQEGDLVMLENTLPTTPGALLGYRKDGVTPIYLIAGGAPEDGEGQSEQQDAQISPAETGVTPPEEPAVDEPVNPDARRVDQLPSWAQKLIKDARKEAGDYRTRLADAQKSADEATKQQGPSQEEITNQVKSDFAQQIAKALGLAAEETPPSPEQVIETLTAERDTTAAERDKERERHRRALIELAVHRASQKVGADPDALLDSRSFLKAVRDMDPDADNFSTSLAETIQTAVENNPKFKAASQAGPPARSGGEFTGGPGERAPSSEPSIDEFRALRRKRASSDR